MPKISIPEPKFNLLKKNKTDKIGYLLLVFRWNGNKLTYSLGQYLTTNINIKDWDKNKQRLPERGKNSDKVNANKRINEKLAAIKRHVQNFYQKNPNLNKDALKQELDYFTKKEKRPTKDGRKIPTLFEAIDELIEYKKSKHLQTGVRIQVIKHHLEDYEKVKKVKLSYDSFDWKFKNDFQQYLYGKKCATNYASKLFMYVKHILQETARLGYHSNKIYLEKGYSLEKKKTSVKTVFSFSELNILQQYDLSSNPRLERVRDLFLVGCYTGLRFSDWHKVNKQNITGEDDEQLLNIVTQKTKTEVFIPCIPELTEVLEKYDYELPKISSQKFNDYIKEVVQLALPESNVKITYSIAGATDTKVVPKHTVTTSHCARRTFATNFFEAGIPASILIQITGHSTEKQFFEYVDADKKKLAARFAKLVKQNLKQRHLRVAK